MRYAAHMIKLNEYLDIFAGSQEIEKIGETELNEILLHCMPNFWIIQMYVQGFYFETVTCKQVINIFEIMEIAEGIYEGVVDPY